MKMHNGDDTQTLVRALRCLAHGGIYCEEWIANAVIAEAADRLEEMASKLRDQDNTA